MANKNVTLKDKDNNSLFPKTFDYNVFNGDNESMDNVLASKLEYTEDTTGGTDPSPLVDYYNKAQTDALLNQRANVGLSNVTPTLTSSSYTNPNTGSSGTKYNGFHYVIESWKATDNSMWYRKYNDGWKECGGNINGSGSFGDYTTNFPTTFLTSNYTLVVNGFWQDSTGRGSVVESKSVSSFKVNLTNQNGNATYFACGY